MDLRIARETGYDGVLVVGDKLRRYLAEGFSIEQAAAAVDGLPVLGMNNIRARPTRPARLDGSRCHSAQRMGRCRPCDGLRRYLVE